MNQEIIEGRDCEVQKPSSLAPLPTTLLNITVTQCGHNFEVWVRWGKKAWRIGVGTLDEMSSKADRVRKFASDPFAPLPGSVADFAMMARGI